MAKIDVKIETRTGAARAWVVVMGVLGRVVGNERAIRWAIAGAWRLTRYRVVGTKKWQRFPRELHDRAVELWK